LVVAAGDHYQLLPPPLPLPPVLTSNRRSIGVQERARKVRPPALRTRRARHPQRVDARFGRGRLHGALWRAARAALRGRLSR